MSEPTNKLFELQYTERGFMVGTFWDRYDQECSIQESSLSEAALWLGVDKDMNGVAVNQRMHLTREHVEALIPLLTKFVETGRLKE